MQSIYEYFATSYKYLTTLQGMQDKKFSRVAQFLCRELSYRVHGVCGRSASDTDPTVRDPQWFIKRFHEKPGYVLFAETIYYLYFKNQQPVIEACVFNIPLTSEIWADIRALFPPETTPLKDAIDSELASITALIRPVLPAVLPQLNSRLLSPYFINTYSSDLPLVDFCDINLCITTDEQNSKQYCVTDNRPTLVLNDQKEQYFLYGNNRHHWQLSTIKHSLLTKNLFNQTVLHYDPRYTPLYQHIIRSEAHRHVSAKPEQVSQINKIMHGLMSIASLLQEIENIGPRNIIQTALNYSDLYDKAHEAIYFLIDFDINFIEKFEQEISSFLAESAKWPPYLQQFIPQEMDDRDTAWSYFRQRAYQLGKNMGLVIRHIYAKDGKLDFKVLSEFSAILPQHIDALTTWLNDHTAAVTQHAPNIDRTQVATLQKEATTLLKTLKNNQTANLGLWQIINYIYLIRQVIVLLSTTVSQIGYLHGAYQELIRTYLQILKYQLLPRLFAFGDKIEIECMLEPGSITQGVMQKARELFAFFTPYLKNIANFSMLGEELLTIEDAKFMHLRSLKIQAIENDCHITKMKLSWFAKDSAEFFEILKNYPQEREVLAKKYQAISTEFKRMDPITHEQILDFLSHSDNTLSLEYISSVLYYVQTYCQRVIATQDLRRKQYHAVQKNINRHANLYVFPYGELSGCDMKLLAVAKDTDLTTLVLEKSPMLIQSKNQYHIWGHKNGISWDYTPIPIQYIDAEILHRFENLPENSKKPLVYNEKHLSLYQQIIIKKAHVHFLSVFDEKNQQTALPSDDSQTLLNLHCWYRNKEQAFIKAMTQLDNLANIIKNRFPNPSDIIQFTANDAIQKECRSLYADVQAYLIGLEEFREFDNGMANLLAAESRSIHTITMQSFDAILQKTKSDYKKQTRKYWIKRTQYFLNQARDKYKTEYKIMRVDDRKHYELHSTVFSETLEKIMQSFAKWQAMILPTHQNSTGKLHVLFTHCNQFLAHIKNTALKLEALKNMDYIDDASERLRAKEAQFKTITWPMYDEILGLIAVGKIFYHDQYLKKIITNGYAEIMMLVSTVSELIKPYTLSPLNIEPTENIQYAGLWYTMNALYIFPDHLLDRTKKKPWTDDDRSKTQIAAKKATLTIEYLVKNSHSYFQLLLSLYAIYDLNNALRAKLAHFSATSYQVVEDHLQDIKRDYISKLLVWLSRWEDTIDVDPFVLVNPVKTMVMDWYQGLIYPLQYSFKEKEALICSVFPIHEEIIKEEQALQDIQLKLDPIKTQLAAIDSFLERIDAFEKSILPTIWDIHGLAQGFWELTCPKIVDQSLQDDYRNIIRPMLCAYTQSVRKILQRESLGAIKKNLEDFKMHLGERARHDDFLSITRRQEKIDCLQNLERVPAISVAEYRASFAQKYFIDQLSKCCSENPKFKHIEIAENYRLWLTAHLHSKKTKILENAQSQNDLDTFIATALQDLSKNFRMQYEQQFKQLDAILTAIQACQNCIFTDPLSMGLRVKKIYFLHKLKKCLIPSQDSDVVWLGIYLKDKLFSVQLELLKYEKHLLEEEAPAQDFLSWIMACFWWCLAALGLYKPTFTASYDKLVSATADTLPKPPKSGAGRFFSSKPQRIIMESLPHIKDNYAGIITI